MEILSSLSPAAQDNVWRYIEAQLDAFTTPAEWAGPNELLLCSAVVPLVQAI